MYNHKESVEDYLEKILMLNKEGKIVRSIDLARSMNFAKASISVAVKKMKELNYLEIDETTGELRLTDSGRKIAQDTLARHLLLAKALEKIGVDSSIAEKDACKIEHLLSEETIQAIQKYIKK